MQITDRAKDLINIALKADKGNAILFQTTKSCCGNSLKLDVVNTSTETELINGISVIMDEKTKEWTKDIILDAENNRLKLINPTGSGCCGGKGCC